MRAFNFGMGSISKLIRSRAVSYTHLAHQHVRDVQGLFAVIRLGDEQFVGVHAQAPGIGHIQGVLCLLYTSHPPTKPGRAV